MKKGYVIALIICAVMLGTCSVPFLPITNYIFLKNYEKTTKLGPYKIKARILLFENEKEANMRIHATFAYPADKLIQAGCIVDVVVDIEDYELLDNTIIETTSDSSIEDPDDSGESRRLVLILDDVPIAAQNYTLELKPKSGKKNAKCKATKTIKHKIGYERSSMFDIAMGV